MTVEPVNITLDALSYTCPSLRNGLQALFRDCARLSKPAECFMIGFSGRSLKNERDFRRGAPNLEVLDPAGPTIVTCCR
jgi:hypothetical protein